MAVELRSRDQVWQLLVATGAVAAVLIIAGMVAFGGGDGTETVGLTVPEGEAGTLIAGPSDGNDRLDEGSQRRSGGPIDGDTDDRSPVDGPRPSVRVEASTSTSRATTERSTTTVPTTTTTTVSTTSAPKTTVEQTTSEATTTSVATTTVPSTRPSSTRPPSTRPPVTIGPIESLPPVGKDHSITPKDLAAAREQWRSMGYDSYGMTVNRICFCPNAGPLEVVVRNGELQSVRPVDGDGESRKVYDRGSLTVPGLFALVESGFEADGLKVVFDKMTGVPLSIEIDYIRRAIDDELTVIVRDFQPHRNR